MVGNKECGHAEVEGGGDVAGEAVADEDGLLRGYPELV